MYEEGTEPRRLTLVVPVYNAPDLARALVARIPELDAAARGSGFELVETILVDDGSDVRLDAAPQTIHASAYGARRANSANGAERSTSLMSTQPPFRYGRPGMPLVRRFLSRAFHALVRLACGMDVQDTQCGFKLFRMDVMRAVFAAQRIERFAFDVELIRRARDAGGTVKEVPVAWCGGKRSSLRVFRDAPRMLWDLLRIGPCRASSQDRTRAGR